MTPSTVELETPEFDCTETVRRLWDYLDRELSADDVRAIDTHLAACAKCQPHVAFERAFLTAMRTARSEASAGPALRARVRIALGLDAPTRQE